MFHKAFRKLCAFYDNVDKYGTVGQSTDYNMTRRMRIACWVTDYKYNIRIRKNHCLSTVTLVMRTHLNVTLPVYCPCC